MILSNDVIAFLKRQNASRLPRSQDFRLGHVAVYLRAGNRPVLTDGKIDCVSVVAVARIDVKPQGAGHFKAFIQELEAVAPTLGYAYCRFEQVHNEDLQRMLLKNGYCDKSTPNDDLIFLKPLEPHA